MWRKAAATLSATPTRTFTRGVVPGRLTAEQTTLAFARALGRACSSVESSSPAAPLARGDCSAAHRHQKTSTTTLGATAIAVVMLIGIVPPPLLVVSACSALEPPPAGSPAWA